MRYRPLQLSVTAALAAAAVLVGTAAGAVPRPAASDASTTTALIFAPNPVQSTGDQDLTDRKDADYPELLAAYTPATLTDLDGSGTLTGTYVRVKSTTGKAAKAVGGVFPAYHRDADQFEQVMGYHWVTTAQKYLQSLGFDGTDLPKVNQRQIELRINQFGVDNAYYRSDKTNISLGKGGVDDGEDAEVIVHEYGHSVQDSQVPGFPASLQAGSIGEGFSDYLAVAVSSWATRTPTRTDEACVADWDSVSYTNAPHCLRRIDGAKHFRDAVGQVHADGEIWSSALYAIRAALGDQLAGRIIVDAQFDFAPDTTFADAAAKTVASAREHGGNRAKAAAETAFEARGLR